MDDQKLKIFNSIASFVSDLNIGFGKKYKPVALYNRLVEKTEMKHESAIKRHIFAFEKFFDSNPNFISKKELTNNALIIYSDRVYLDIGKILHRSDHDSHDFIYQHLLTIFSLIHVDDEKGKEALDILQNIQTNGLSEDDFNPDEILGELDLPDSKEGEFIKNTIGNLTNHIDVNNPMGSVMNMMSSGFLNTFMEDMNKQMESGEVDMSKLIGVCTNMIQKSGKDEQMASMDPNLKNMFTGVISQINNVENNDENIKQETTRLLNVVTGNNTNENTEPIQMDDVIKQMIPDEIKTEMDQYINHNTSKNEPQIVNETTMKEEILERRDSSSCESD